MPSFPTDYDSLMETLAPYYHDERPLDYFFELYVCDVLNELPKKTLEALSNYSDEHPSFFSDCDGDWKKYVVNRCNLSDTIETAIWDLWIKNAAIAKRDGWNYHPWHFAQNFIENYLTEGSKVDVWEGATLEMAKKRISEYRKNR